MNKKIHLIKNNDKKDWTDLEWIEEFYQFLQGENPDSITCPKMRLTKNQAFRIIWYLQEHFPVFPDQIEKCSVCGDLYDSYSSGYYSEKRGKHYCNSCDRGYDY